MYHQLLSTPTQPDIVLTKALKKAAAYWGLGNKHLGDVLGLSESSISRLKNSRYVIEPETKSWQLAVLFLRVFRGLDAYMGGNIEHEKQWLSAHNTALGGAPIELMKNVEGLIHVVQYVDFMRGQ